MLPHPIGGYVELDPRPNSQPFSWKDEQVNQINISINPLPSAPHKAGNVALSVK